MTKQLQTRGKRRDGGVTALHVTTSNRFVKNQNASQLP